MQSKNIVTGAFSFTGKYIAQRLLALGEEVKTLTRHPRRDNTLARTVAVAPLDFADTARLTESLRGATTLYNTYWVRFPHGKHSFERAVQNTKILIRAARMAGIRRIVHASVSNPSKDSGLPYFRGKALTEEVVVESGLSYAIIRPTVIFGAEDILINNIAWLLRRFPIFAVFGSGDYRLQPVFVDDVADLAVVAGHDPRDLIVEAAGPEIFSFEELVRQVAAKIGRKARLVNAPPWLALLLCRLVGLAVRDIVLTREEVAALMSNLLVSPKPPNGRTRFSEWLAANAERVGTRYASELARHFR